MTQVHLGKWSLNGIIISIIIIRSHCLHAVHKMRRIATDVAHCVDCPSVCGCVGYTGELCKNG